MSQNTTPEIVAAKDPTVWEINGHQFVIDMHDADQMERYEKAFEKMGEAEKAIPKDGKQSEILRKFCTLFRDLFNDLFGPGTDEKLFGSTNNARIAIEIYDDFLSFVDAQRTNAGISTAATIQKYAQYSSNRAQRRAASKK